MDSDLSAEIARIEAELAQDAEMRQQQQFSQQQQQQQQPSPPQQPQQAPPQQQQQSPNPFNFGAPVFAAQQQQPQQQQQQPQQQQQQQPSLFNVNASPFTPPQPQQQQDYTQQYQQQQQSFMGGSTDAQANNNAANAAANMHSFSKDTDSRSVFIGNLPKGTDGGATTTPEELVQFLSDCGPILNCTVLKDRATGELKGTAYVEFADYTAMGKAIDTKNNANFKGSTIIVTHKRSSFKPGRGGRGVGRGRGRGGADSLQAIAALMGMLGAVNGFRGRGGRGGPGRGGRGGRGGPSTGGGASMPPGGMPPGGFQPYQ